MIIRITDNILKCTALIEVYKMGAIITASSFLILLLFAINLWKRNLLFAKTW